MKAYISGPLMAARDLPKLRRLYEQFAVTCKKAGWSSYLPHQHTDPLSTSDLSEEVVVERDIKELTVADVVLAYLGEPSIGVGAEIAIAIHQEKHVLALFERSRPVSRFIIGLLKRHPKAKICAFTKLAEANSWIEQSLKGVMLSASAVTNGGMRPEVFLDCRPATVEARPFA